MHCKYFKNLISVSVLEGAAPVTLLVRDESRSTRSTSMNKDESLDLDVIENQNNPCESRTSHHILEETSNEYTLSRQPTTSIDETDTATTTELRLCKKSTTSSLALQIVDVDSIGMLRFKFKISPQDGHHIKVG